MTGAGPLFDDGKADGAMRTIGEVSSALGIKPHVLRYWEQQFPMLEPLKRSGGRRLYRAEDVALVETINRLVNQEGYTLKGAKKAIQSAGASGTTVQLADSAASVSPTPAARVASDTVEQLRAIRDRLSAALEA
ncbi:MerR family transcriptional regulator [Aurantiacibacter aquimixticola]|uniref:MerR family transcriptional regulator n=1 Tax=Aurantiacibacter aquimixticola TaxID=1958945 RepID=A0A419RR44_9SPHN|nr:MerR family transcriptional regulator [Aurantiacibacter aquimixticola]RJY08273.1 MerR family transcriptional regulator [Aurantiacibacter aquimixticola]